VVISPDKLNCQALFSFCSGFAWIKEETEENTLVYSILCVPIGPQCVQTASHTNTENVEILPPLPHDPCFVFAFEELQHSKLSLLLS